MTVDDRSLTRREATKIGVGVGAGLTLGQLSLDAAEARLGRYGGQVIVHVDSLEPRVVTVELLVQGYAGGHDPEGVLDIGTTKQLLIDDYIVGDVEGGAITYHSFEKHPRNPLILPDGIEGSDDPILSARSAAYSESFNRRTREQAEAPNRHQEPQS